MTAPLGYTTDAPLPSPGVPSDRALYAIRELVRACLPQLALLGLWDYRIDSVVSQSIVMASPVDPSLGLPGAVRVTLTPSILGEQVTPSVGSRLVLAFLDGNASKPMAIAGDPDARPTLATILGPGAASARLGDEVDCGVLTAKVGTTPVEFTYTDGQGNTFIAVQSITILGEITTGSAKVTVG